jgi:hypothetical protein
LYTRPDEEYFLVLLVVDVVELFGSQGENLGMLGVNPENGAESTKSSSPASCPLQVDGIVGETREERRGANGGSWGDREREERLESMQVGDAHHQ